MVHLWRRLCLTVIHLRTRRCLHQALIVKEGARVMSLTDGKSKMSKSDPVEGSRINLTDPPDVITKKVSTLQAVFIVCFFDSTILGHRRCQTRLKHSHPHCQPSNTQNCVTLPAFVYHHFRLSFRGWDTVKPTSSFFRMFCSRRRALMSDCRNREKLGGQLLIYFLWPRRFANAAELSGNLICHNYFRASTLRRPRPLPSSQGTPNTFSPSFPSSPRSFLRPPPVYFVHVSQLDYKMFRNG